MTKNKWQVVSRLKSAVRKITLLLNLNMARWRVATFLGGGASRRRFSFNDRPGLHAAFFDDDVAVSPHGPSGRMLTRTASCYSSDDDVDRKAEKFIANFYRQLRIERQISLELNYCRGNSFGSSSPSPS